MEQLNYEVKKHAQIFSEIGTLNYDDFQKCLSELNELFVAERQQSLEVNFCNNNITLLIDRENVWIPAESNLFLQ